MVLAQYDEGYLLFRPWQSEHHCEKLFEHTRHLRERAQERSRSQTLQQGDHREFLVAQRRMSQGSSANSESPRDGSPVQRNGHSPLGQASHQHQITNSDYNYSSSAQAPRHQNDFVYRQRPDYERSSTSPNPVYAPTAPIPINTTHSRYQPVRSSLSTATKMPPNSLPADIWQGPSTPGGQWAPQSPLLAPTRPRASSYRSAIVEGSSWQGPALPGAQWSPRLAQALPSSSVPDTRPVNGDYGAPEMAERRRSSIYE